MRGKHAKASARREVAQLEVQNEELCAKVRKLEADLKDIAKHGEGSDGVEALAKFLIGKDVGISFYTELMKEVSVRGSNVQRMMERMRRWKAEKGFRYLK